MKQFTILKKQGYKKMNDGVQTFNGAVVTAMDKIQLYDQMDQSYMIEINDTRFFISIGYNARFFKTDGQQYCTYLHIEKDNKCYLYSCFCSWRQSEIEEHINRMIQKVNELSEDKTYNFDFEFEKHKSDYPWQTS